MEEKPKGLARAAGSDLEANQKGGIGDDGEEIDLTQSKPPPVHIGRAPGRPLLPKPPRDKQLERGADRLIRDATALWTDRDGVFDVENVKKTLRRALEQIDPDFKDANEAKAICDTLKHGLRGQDNSSVSAGVNRALVDQLAVGVAAGVVSARAVASKLGVARKRLRTAVMSASVPDSFKRPRKTRADAFGASVEQAVREWVYSYTKYTEKTFVCLLAKVKLWQTYCMFHDKNGMYYSKGACHTPSHPPQHINPTHTDREPWLARLEHREARGEEGGGGCGGPTRALFFLFL
mgnify:CR=1 FL=1